MILFYVSIMRKLFILTFLITVTTNLFAQQIDERSMFFENFVNEYKKQPIFLQDSIIENFTTTSLYFNYDKGENRMAQHPNQMINFGLQAEGIQRNKKNTLFFGTFKINKAYAEDSKWSLDLLEE